MSDISILFSGGPDSTLAALYALQDAQRVHLLTYHHRLMSHCKLQSGKIKCEAVVEELKKIYSKDRIIHRKISSWPLFKKIYYGNISYDIQKYRSFCIPWICGACKLAMHIKTIEYNLGNNIRITYDGNNKESASVFPAQTVTYINVIKELYVSHQMIYQVPIYDIEQADSKTEEFGLTSCKGTKAEHVFFSTQHSCFVGLLLHIHARVYKLLKGDNPMEELTSKMLKTRIKDMNIFLRKKST